ncbi:MAG: hypothetical protein AVDCRST_MAG93-6873 [uncultured Chloroflexia bacterium]|uniref:Uncharacterized protein n=1 Tax=uncultured Chloroflexia bacterium TaxID=1672391 RepID=A0A6J4LZK5_9CHLR|nr:MAG: hypothetical protein AVDCRST_MAG93-6873 [uncultured Chloroflexia bacterium]
MDEEQREYKADRLASADETEGTEIMGQDEQSDAELSDADLSDVSGGGRPIRIIDPVPPETM